MDAQLESVNKTLCEVMQQLMNLRRNAATVTGQLDRMDAQFLEQEAEIATIKMGKIIVEIGLH